MRTELPEDKLLHLIRSKAGKHTGTHIPEVSSAKPGRSSAENILGRIAFDPRYILYVNWFLSVVVVFSVFYALRIFIVPFEKRFKAVAVTERRTAPDDHTAVSQGANNDNELKDYSVYAGAIGGRQLFVSESIPEIAEISQASGLGDRFMLVGIIKGDAPQAVIEDKVEGKTYYLYKGASFNETIVEDIGSGKVILNSGGERISLVL